MVSSEAVSISCRSCSLAVMGVLGRGDIPDYSDAVLDVDRCFCGLGYELKVWGWESG